VTAAIRQNWFTVFLVCSLISASGAAYFAAPRINVLFLETTRHAGFVLSNLSIVGNDRTSRYDILTVLDIDDGMPLLSIDLVALQERIEKLPWVKQAAVTRVFPGDLKVQIIERTPYALWQHDQRIQLIDPDGAVITSRNLSEFASLPIIVGDSAPTVVASLFQKVSAEPEMAVRIKSAVRISDRRWDLIFDNGVRVKLPEDSAVDYNSTQAWQKLAQLQSQYKILEREVSVIDMRLPGRSIMRVTPVGRRMMDGKEWAT